MSVPSPARTQSTAVLPFLDRSAFLTWQCNMVDTDDTSSPMFGSVMVPDAYTDDVCTPHRQQQGATNSERAASLSSHCSRFLHPRCVRYFPSASVCVTEFDF